MSARDILLIILVLALFGVFPAIAFGSPLYIGGGTLFAVVLLFLLLK